MKICSDTLVRHKKWKIFKKEIAEMFPIVARSMGLEMANKYSGEYFSQNWRDKQTLSSNL